MDPRLTTAGKIVALIGTIIWLIGIGMTALLVISFVFSGGVMFYVMAMSIYANPVAGTLLFATWPLLIVIGVYLRRHALSERYDRMRDLSSYESGSDPAKTAER